jgi:hypothetical protein
MLPTRRMILQGVLAIGHRLIQCFHRMSPSYLDRLPLLFERLC